MKNIKRKALSSAPILIGITRFVFLFVLKLEITQQKVGLIFMSALVLVLSMIAIWSKSEDKNKRRAVA